MPQPRRRHSEDEAAVTAPSPITLAHPQFPDVEQGTASSIDTRRERPSVVRQASLSPTLPWEEYETLSLEFGDIELVSTLAATLIVTFLQVAQDVFITNGSRRRAVFESCMVVALIGTVFHIGAILISSRAGRVCQKLATMTKFAKDNGLTDAENHTPELGESPVQRYRRVDFYRYLKHCEWMQSMGTTTVVLCAHLLMFGMFSGMEFSIIFVVAMVLGDLWLLGGAGLWKLLVLREILSSTFLHWMNSMGLRRQAPVQPSNHRVV